METTTEMGLSTEQIEKNAKTFFATGEKYGFTNERLVELIGEGMISAPASMTEEGYNSFEGGLIAHIIKLTSHALKINESLSEEKQVTKEGLVKACFLHQIGKAKMFTPRDSQWHLDRGMNYEFNDGEVALKVAELSIKYLFMAGIELSDDDYNAIALYGTEFSNRPMTTVGERTAAIVKAAGLIAIIEEK